MRTDPAVPGVYRIRRQGGIGNRLVYIGQTGRTLRERLLALAAGVNAEQCPFNDPHTAAPHLWFLRRQSGARLECSCAPTTGDVQVLRGTEDMLLWRHRVTTGVSTEANYGRFYPGYTRPTNRWIVKRGHSSNRTPGRRAAAIAEGGVGVDFTMSHPPLQGDAGPLQAPWWQRGPLSEARTMPVGPAVYLLCATQEPKWRSTLARPTGFEHEPSLTPHRVGQFGSPGWHTCRCLVEHRSMCCESWRVICWVGTFGTTGRAPIAQYLERQREVGKASPL